MLCCHCESIRSPESPPSAARQRMSNICIWSSKAGQLRIFCSFLQLQESLSQLCVSPNCRSP